MKRRTKTWIEQDAVAYNKWLAWGRGERNKIKRQIRRRERREARADLR